MYLGLHVRCLVLFSAFNQIWIFSADLNKSLLISNFMKIRPLGSELTHVDRHDEANWHPSPLCEIA